MEDFGEVQQDALRRLAVASEGELKVVAEGLDIDAAEVTKAEGKGKLGLQRVIRRYLDSEEIAESSDEGKAVWVKVCDLLADVVRVEAHQEGTETKKEEEASHTEEDEKSARCPAEKEASNGAKMGATPDMGGAQGPVTFATWRKEFRIIGQIGEPGQKDRLSFVSLARQVENGVKKGFPQEEIIEAVVRSVSPGLRLRSYLEGRADLSLPDLRRLLRAHYREKDATALFQELSTAAQQSKETPHDFVLRVLDLRQKVIFASQEAGAGVIYDPKQTQRMALRSISTGIASETIQVEMRSKLGTEKISDEDLLEALTFAVEHEAERAQKLKPCRSTRAAAVEVRTTEPVPTQTPKVTTTPSTGLDLKELAASIQAIVKAEVNALRTEDRATQRRPPRERGCPNCRKAGTGNTCNHCFRCGSSDHFLRGCRVQRSQGQGNGQGLQERDNQ